MGKVYTALFCIIINFCFCVPAFSWGNKFTHPALTEKAIANSNQSALDDYLKSVLGISQGLNAELTLDQSTVPVGNRIPKKQLEDRILPVMPTNPSITNFLTLGSRLEDVPHPRARHHFHDPYRNTGLENKTDHPNWAASIDLVTRLRYGLGFDLTGASNLERALGTESGGWENEYENYFAWPDARDYFYKALTEEPGDTREHYLALTFLTLGHVLHMIEDMGVPAHARNDFIEAHYRPGIHPLPGPGLDIFGIGNPLENWLERKMSIAQFFRQENSIVFNKVASYWDTSGYDGTGDGCEPPDDWGLAERSNYQFLSLSTIFREDDGNKYYFPHPSWDIVKNNPETVETVTIFGFPLPIEHRYAKGYGINHLARVLWIEEFLGYPISECYTTIGDEYIYEDYANITIPRTIDYVTGVSNYFFRGQFDVTSVVESWNGDLLWVNLFITNESKLTGPVDEERRYALKGGMFEVYWDDIAGNRYPISNFEIVGGWGPGSTLPYNEMIQIELDDDPDNTLENAVRFVVVYRGNILEEPALIIDEDDIETIATASIEACHICNIPPETFLLARFEGIDRCWFTPATEFNNRGFRLEPDENWAGYFWTANKSSSGRQIGVSCQFEHNRDRIFVNVRDDYNGDRLFHSGDWDGLEYFPETMVNACSCWYPNTTCNSIGPVIDCDGHCGTCAISFWDIPDWQSSIGYTEGDQVGWGSPEGDCFEVYTCTLNHISGAGNQPGVGFSWEDYWLLGYPDVEVDLDIDGVMERDEEDPGGTVQVGGPLIEIYTLILSHWPDFWTNELNRGSATLEAITGTDKIRIWDNPSKSGQPLIDQDTPKKTWQLMSELVPITLYVEGITASSYPMDVRLKFTLNYAGVEKYDKVNFTVQD